MEPLKYTRKNRPQISGNCPCGKSNKDSKFVPFEGYSDKGYCHSCNQTFFPEDDTPVKPDMGHKYSQKIVQKYIDTKVLAVTMGGYKENNFVKWLTNLIGVDDCKKVINRFCVGTSKSGGTVFWTIDQGLNVCQPKVFYYKPDGHRDKDKNPLVPKGYTRDSGFIPCLFGLHQLNPKYGDKKPIALVESEKTAILGFHAFPKFNWLATGGSTLSYEKAQPLKGYKVIVIPDSDTPGREGAERTQKRLSELGIAANICDLFPNKDNGFDLADYLVDKLKPDSVLDKMIEKNPVVKTLIERFEFEEC